MENRQSLPVEIKAVSPLIGNQVPMPRIATDGSAGVDLAACISEPITLQPGERRLVPTGIAIQPPGPHVAAFVFARSGLAARSGIHLANGVGVIDSDYRGEIQVALVNGGDVPFVIEPASRVAQMVFMPVFAVHWLPVDELETSGRGGGGFGHTGVR